MAIVPYESIDYLTEARGRVTEQLKEKDVFDRYIQLLIAEQTEIQNTFKDLLQKRSIDEATGAQLDIIGRIVGQSRELISVGNFDFFGFAGAPQAGSFGTVGNPQIGSKFWNLGTHLAGNILLDDETYRLFIKAKILKNQTASTPEEVLAFVNFLFGTEQSAIFEGQAEYTIMFGRVLSLFEQNLLNYITNSPGYPSRLIPKTVGVRVNFGYFLAGQYFGFQGVPGAKGFGGLNAQASGYGLRWGENYGLSDYSQDVDCRYSHVADGSVLANGTVLADSEYTCYPADGGYFAELINL